MEGRNCLLIDQGFGELLTPPFIDVKGQKAKAVTTYDCRTCLCVYVRFVNNDVFIAHMCAYTKVEKDPDLKQKQVQSQEKKHSESPNQDQKEEQNQIHDQNKIRDEDEVMVENDDEEESMDGNEDEIEEESEDEDEDEVADPFYDTKWKSSPEKGAELKAIVLAQLHAQLSSHAGQPVAEAFAVCPAIFLDGPEANGRYMKDAVVDFFQPANIVLRDNRHGFVAGPGVTTAWLRCVESRNVEEEVVPMDFGWKHVDSYLTEGENVKLRFGPWAFRYMDGRWKVGP